MERIFARGRERAFESLYCYIVLYCVILCFLVDLCAGYVEFLLLK